MLPISRYAAAALVIALASLSQAATSSAQPEKAKAEESLIATEARLNRVFGSGDKSAFMQLLAPDAVWVSGSGFIPAALLADAIDDVKLANARIENPKVLWADANAAVVISVWMGSGIALGEPFAPKVSSTVWAKRGDKWIAVYHHDSNAPSQ